MRVADNLIEKRVGDVLILAPLDKSGLPDTEHAFCLEGVAVDVWELLSRGVEMHNIVSELCCRYAVSKVTLNNDVSALLGQFVDMGLIIE